MGLRSRGRRARRLQEEAWERERWGRRVRRARYLVVQRRPQAVQVAFQLVLRFDLLTLVFVRLGVLFRLLPSVHGNGVRKHEWTGDEPPTTDHQCTYLEHALDLVLGQAPLVRRDGDLLRLARRLVLRRHLTHRADEGKSRRTGNDPRRERRGMWHKKQTRQARQASKQHE